MKLSKDQIQYIDDYIAAAGVEWYDVRTELVDHFANILEGQIKDDPNLHLKKELTKIHKQFNNNGFKELINTKTKEVERKYFKSVSKYLLSFFTIPKIILTIFSFYALVRIMNSFNNIEFFFNILYGFLMLIAAQFVLRKHYSDKKKGEKFLTLDRGRKFNRFFFLFLLFNSVTILRTDHSFENQLYNYVQLFVFVVMILFYISIEVIYFYSKKEIKHQYPDIKIV